ncbi:MAG: glycoside hydrolase, partial [Actinomycetota bacterium]|nr:glycoside hydrolase [Actinomycetota bacterium]
MARSTDGGRRFEAPVRVAGPLTFQPRLAVDPKGPVYVTWLQAQETVLNGFAQPFPYVVAVRSDDGARSFGPPARVSDPERERLGSPSGVVDSQGRLVVLYEDFKDNRRDFSYLEGPPAERPFALVVTSSTDGGRSFSRGTEIESGVVATRRFLIFLPEAPTLARGPGDELYVAWADGRNGDDDVFLRRSADGGRSWSEPVRVNDNAQGDGTDQLLPKVAVAPDGRVDVLFLDRRHDPQDILTDAYLASSDDGGRTFDNLRVSTQSFDSRVGPTFGPDYGTDFGTKLGLDSAGDTAFAAWTDTRLGNEASGSQDVAFARVTLPDAPPALVGWPVVVGLLVMGGIAMVGGTRGGNRTPSGASTDQRSTASVGSRSGRSRQRGPSSPSLRSTMASSG